MSFLVVTTWRDRDGQVCSGPITAAARTEVEAQRQVTEGLATARRAGGTRPVCQVLDDVTGGLVMRVRPRGPR